MYVLFSRSSITRDRYGMIILYMYVDSNSSTRFLEQFVSLIACLLHSIVNSLMLTHYYNTATLTSLAIVCTYNKKLFFLCISHHTRDPSKSFNFLLMLFDQNVVVSYALLLHTVQLMAIHTSKRPKLKTFCIKNCPQHRFFHNIISFIIFLSMLASYFAKASWMLFNFTNRRPLRFPVHV